MDEYYEQTREFTFSAKRLQTILERVFAEHPVEGPHRFSELMSLKKVDPWLPRSEVDRLAAEVAPDVLVSVLLSDSDEFLVVAQDVVTWSWARWILYARKPNGEPDTLRCAYVRARPSVGRRTIVSVGDGRLLPNDVHRGPIGSVFKSFADELMEQCETAISDLAERDRAISEAKQTYRLSTADPLSRVEDQKLMRRFYEDYNSRAALHIIKALPRAWNLYCAEEGRWGPGYIARVCGYSPGTVGRYLRAFWKAGIEQIGDVSIPYRPKSPR